MSNADATAKPWQARECEVRPRCFTQFEARATFRGYLYEIGHCSEPSWDGFVVNFRGTGRALVQAPHDKTAFPAGTGKLPGWTGTYVEGSRAMSSFYRDRRLSCLPTSSVFSEPALRFHFANVAQKPVPAVLLRELEAEPVDGSKRGRNSWDKQDRNEG
jgi:hypothetical protein